MILAKKLEFGQVDFVIVLMESVISLNIKFRRVVVKVVVVILQEDVSVIVVLVLSDINCFVVLDGRSYVFYGVWYEDKIVQQMVCNDGGKGEFYFSYLNKFGIWNILFENKVDVIWIF